MKTNLSLRFKLFLCFIMLLSSSLGATNYYASPSGTGSGSSYSDPGPFETGRASLSSIDTLYLLGGQYNFTAKVTISKSGTASAYKVIAAYPGETPIFDFRGETYGEVGLSISDGITYVHIKGLNIRYAGKNGIINYGSYCILENCNVYGCGNTGIQHKTGGGNLIKNCDSHDNFDYETGGISAADFGGNADGFADKQYTNSNGNTYDSCRSWNNSDDGWDFFQRVGSNTVIKNCICYANGPASLNMTNNPRYNTDKAWFDQFPITVTNADGGSDNITLANYKNYGNGNGFKMGGDYTVNNLTLQNCLSVNNQVRGYDQNNNAGAMTVINCSAYNNGTNFGFSKISGSSLSIKNCVSLSSQSSDYFQCPTVVTSNNSWNTTGVTCTSADFQSIASDSSSIIATRTSSGSLPDITFMHLVSGSDLIDAGTNVGLSYSGSAPDLGCFEYGASDHWPGTLTLTSGSISQSIAPGSSIETIVLTYGGGAKNVSVTGLTSGLNSVIDTTAHTITISGTPDVSVGSYSFTVSTTGSTNDTSIIVSLIIKSSSAKKVAFVTTTGGAASDAVMLAKLNANLDFSVSIVDATATGSDSYDYSSYDLIVISPAPSSTATGMAHLEGINKPLLLLKSFNLKPTVWNWGTAVNTSDLSVNVSVPNHSIFSGLNVSSGLKLFSSVNTNAVTGITHSSWGTTPTVLATASSNSATDAIVEFPVGTTIGGITTTKRMLMIGLSESSTSNLTEDATTLIQNSCYYLLGMNIPTSVCNKKSSSSKGITYLQTNYSIQINEGAEYVSGLKLYGMSGCKVKDSKTTIISTFGCKPGIYILQIEENDGSNVFKKVVIK